MGEADSQSHHGFTQTYAKRPLGQSREASLFNSDRSGEVAESADPYPRAHLTMIRAPLTLCSLSHKVTFCLFS